MESVVFHKSELELILKGCDDEKIILVELRIYSLDNSRQLSQGKYPILRILNYYFCTQERGSSK